MAAVGATYLFGHSRQNVQASFPNSSEEDLGNNKDFAQRPFPSGIIRSALGRFREFKDFMAKSVFFPRKDFLICVYIKDIIPI